MWVSYFLSYAKINLELDISVRAKTVKLLEENLYDFGFGKNFLDMIQKHK